ncbi:MAG: S1C family serine protease [Bacteroidia bacterium]
MKRNILTAVLILTYITVFSQTKVTILPESAEVTLNGGFVSTSLKLSEKQSNEFLVASLKGYVTQGAKVEDILSHGTSHTIKLQKIVKLPAESKTRKIEFSKVVDGTGKLSTAQYGYMYYAAAINFEDPKFPKAINKTMMDWGFDMVGTNAVFEEKGNAPDLVLACEILNAGKETRGSGFQASVLLNWSVYNVNQKKVVYNLNTGGFSDSKRSHTFVDELILAINDGLVALMSDSKFQELALSASETTSSGKTVEATNLPKITAASYSSYGEMIKGVVGSVVTVKTNFGHGSGFVISKSGFVLTNDHVISGASSIEIIFDNGFSMEGTMVKTDEDRDVAMLKIAGNGFKPLAINTSSDGTSVGTEVIAVGTPADLKLGQTVTKGIVSGKRELEEDNGTKNNYIQTDVSINSGNSGGPLINSKGEVVGIIAAKVKGTGVEGLGFAVPIGEALEKLNIKFE